MDDAAADGWFGEYLDAFSACGRGEQEPVSLLAYLGVPLLVATDDSFAAFVGRDEVLAFAELLVDGTRGTGFDHIKVLGSLVTPLNATSVLLRGAFSRHRSDGAEISRLSATYLLTDGPTGRRISAIAVESV